MITRLRTSSRLCCETARSVSAFNATSDPRCILACPKGDYSRSIHAHSSRRYATEAKAIPRAVLIRSPPPPGPTTQGQPPESATRVESVNNAEDHSIEALLHQFHERVFANDNTRVSLDALYEQLSSNAGKVLEHELPFEDTPHEDRKVKPSAKITSKWIESCRLAEKKLSAQPLESVEEDGLVLVAHVVDSKPVPITSWSLGFVVDTNEKQQYVVSCSHTLESVSFWHSIEGSEWAQRTATMLTLRLFMSLGGTC